MRNDRSVLFSKASGANQSFRRRSSLWIVERTSLAEEIPESAPRSPPSSPSPTEDANSTRNGLTTLRRESGQVKRTSPTDRPNRSLQTPCRGHLQQSKENGLPSRDRQREDCSRPLRQAGRS